jgi:glucose/arabinose dehydrogenase
MRGVKSWILVGCLVALAACSSDDADGGSGVTFGTTGLSVITSTATTPTSSPPSTTLPPTTTPTGTAPSTAVPAPTTVPPVTTNASGDPVVQLTQLGTFEKPVDVTWRPSDGLVYVVEQVGRVVVVTDGQPGAVALDITDLTSARGERGLLGVAISPDSSHAYVDYTANNGDAMIDEFAIAADGTFDKSSRRNVLGFEDPYPNHNGGKVVFGPDGLLYIGIGDGGAGGDPDRRALDLGQWFGKILRIDPRPAGPNPYSVPTDNPFLNVDGARPEIWSVGLRNPWRFSFDRETGDVWIADVGQGQWEEVDVGWKVEGSGRGMNFGWSAFEGNHRYNDDQSPEGATPPVYEYPHGDLGCSISGGARYRGAAIPALVGWYVFGDYCGGAARALRVDGTAVTGEVVLGRAKSISAVVEAPDGELLVLSLDGPIYAITPP